MNIALKFCDLAKEIYSEREILLHRPIFSEKEGIYLQDCIASNYVSSIGNRVLEFEELIADFVGVKKAIACVNGTSALHVSLHALGVSSGTQVLTQALTFVATANSISYTGAEPVFIDVDIDTMGMSPKSLRRWLEGNTFKKGDQLVNIKNGKKISACLPMHTFGMPCRIKEIMEICLEYNIPLIEDAAESLGSYFENIHTGTFGRVGTISFNGNKIITTGGGGVIITNDEHLAKKIKHLTTTAKRTHQYEYFHDEIGFNYRMPNINAAIGVAQMGRLPDMLKAKEIVTNKYKEFFNTLSVDFMNQINNAKSNKWLNAIIFSSKEERNTFLKITNENGVMTRPIWDLMSNLPMYYNCEHDGLINSKWLAERVVNLPSSVPN